MNSKSLADAGNAIERQVFLFGEFAFGGVDKILWQADEIVNLPPKTCELLAVLIENAGRLLTKDELLNAVWKDVYVEESNLSHHIAVLRKTFGADENGKPFIETIPRRGYRFVAPVVLKDKLQVTITERAELRIVEEKIDAPENSLIGREREIAVVKNLLRRRDVKILTLTGVGGAGKTSLARVVMNETQTEFADGACFVDLSAVSRSASVLEIIGRSLGAKESVEENFDRALKNYLREREMLLVLDNFEQVIDAAARISELAAAAAKLKILVTSRERLHLRAERAYAVPPLALPGGEKLPEELIERASVSLFVERARQSQPDFSLTDENALPVAEICKRLDGLPLAIELGAARIRVLSPQSILERLENQLKFLVGGARDLPARQQTMRATINWSYELLKPNEKLFFEFLAVFSGGFTFAAAEKIYAGVIGEAETLELIDSLVNRSLLSADRQFDGETRFRYLEVIREFAAEKFHAGERTPDARRLHAEYFLALAEEIEPHLRSKKAGEIYRQFKIEHYNFRRALDFFRHHDGEKYLRLATAMGLFWATHAYFTEGRARLEDALQNSARKNSKLYALASKNAAIIAYKQGDYAAAENFHTETLRVAELLADEHLRAIAFNGLGTIAYLRGANAAAEKYFEDGLAASRRCGDAALTLSIIVGLSEVKRLEGDWRAARILTEESLVYIRERDLLRPLIGAYINLGTIAFMEGEFESAEQYFRTARAQTLEDDLHSVSLCLDGFAALAAQNKEIERAVELADEAEKIRGSIGYRLELPDRLFREKYLAVLREAKKT